MDHAPIALALYQPDIPQNTGTLLRLCACLAVEAHIIEPAGFPVSDRAFRRAGMDYLDRVTIERHASWTAFDDWRRPTARRLVLATTQGATPYTHFAFGRGDIILLGRESAGVPEAVHAAADARILVPMVADLRSLNVAVAGAMIVGEALRQTDCWPSL
ncbi:MULTISPECIES: tRNA (cytidine(34)-2'-O)-methyltransferase [unclassified Chelatococcus]|uniref:tRNA (cytidine(34)-2'-O)-methyltransferase n=1 Tax=unclassified Chelatococcus TaxID=2638111 RepID=UPI001BCB29B9|nr:MULTISPECIES: tRNA (cytidine(34)-2'-O)-methyltransferase [unclassified Chelatococcus]MBS7697745.1 tRNA (cytidine(34)-2'-O)-methyltransferase [Chelatococcus sp. YT9]MBX3558398.1 tRNA (cytidine(34)-2'-O)-methyltransferase [Chelatococcus sp.]